MKITKQQLKEIIQEELEAVLNEIVAPSKSQHPWETEENPTAPPPSVQKFQKSFSDTTGDTPETPVATPRREKTAAMKKAAWYPGKGEGPGGGNFGPMQPPKVEDPTIAAAEPAPPIAEEDPLDVEFGDVNALMKQIKDHEGKRLEVYKDTVGKDTIGYGHLVQPGEDFSGGITDQQADEMFDRDFESHLKGARQTPGYNLADQTRKGAMVDLAYNMGPSWHKKWPSFSAAATAGDWETAADELVNSKWYGQVGKRAPTIVNMIRTGSPIAVAQAPDTDDTGLEEGIPKPGQNLAEAWGFSMDLDKLNEGTSGRITKTTPLPRKQPPKAPEDKRTGTSRQWISTVPQERDDEDSKELEEKKDDKFLQDVESTGEWTDYTITQLQKKKDTLMKKEKRTADEVKKVRQLNFAINAKQGDYKKKD